MLLPCRLHAVILPSAASNYGYTLTVKNLQIALLDELISPTDLERIQVIEGNYGTVIPELAGINADVMFAMYPNPSAAQDVLFAVNTYLRPGGHFYTVTENNTYYETVSTALRPSIEFERGPAQAGVLNSDIQSGNNPPGIRFQSNYFTESAITVYDLWARR